MLVVTIAAASILGARLLGAIPSAVILPALAAILVFSGWRVWRHQEVAVVRALPPYAPRKLPT